MLEENVKDKARVLIVDDEDSIVDTLSAVLDIRGFEPVTASSSEKAWDILQSSEQRPDLIVLDVLLPGESGLDLCKRMKATAELRSIPVLMITVITRGSDLADGFWKIGSGADDFVSKPFDPFDLADRIEQLLIRHQGISRSKC